MKAIILILNRTGTGNTDCLSLLVTKVPFLLRSTYANVDFTIRIVNVEKGRPAMMLRDSSAKQKEPFLCENYQLT